MQREWDLKLKTRLLGKERQWAAKEEEARLQFARWGGGRGLKGYWGVLGGWEVFRVVGDFGVIGWFWVVRGFWTFGV